MPATLMDKKIQNKMLHNILRFLPSRFRQIAFLMTCQQRKSRFQGSCLVTIPILSQHIFGFLCPSCHIQHMSKLEIVIELCLLFSDWE